MRKLKQLERAFSKDEQERIDEILTLLEQLSQLPEKFEVLATDLENTLSTSFPEKTTLYKSLKRNISKIVSKTTDILLEEGSTNANGNA